MKQSALFLPRFPKIDRITIVVGQPFIMLLALLGVVSIATLATILFAQLGFIKRESVPDPFLDYASVFPGQPWDGALAYEFSCSESALPSVADVSKECVYQPEVGPFSQVHIMIWDGVIMWLDFNVRENALTVGDLSLWWGITEFESGRELIVLRWLDPPVRAIARSQSGRTTYFTPVFQVSFTL